MALSSGVSARAADAGKKSALSNAMNTNLRIEIPPRSIAEDAAMHAPLKSRACVPPRRRHEL
jgi:hypothetical protein